MKLTRGFTLIEVVIYLGLFAILIGGGVICSFNLFEAAAFGSTRMLLQEEQDFLLAKMEWSLHNSEEILSPAPEESGGELILRLHDGSVIRFSHQDDGVSFRRGTNEPVILTTDRVTVVNVHFRHVVEDGSTTRIEYLETALTLSARSDQGRLFTRTATSTIYLDH